MQTYSHLNLEVQFNNAATKPESKPRHTSNCDCFYASSLCTGKSVDALSASALHQNDHSKTFRPSIYLFCAINPSLKPLAEHVQSSSISRCSTSRIFIALNQLLRGDRIKMNNQSTENIATGQLAGLNGLHTGQ